VLRVSHRGRLAGMSSACWPLMDVHVELIDNGALIHAPSRLIPCWSCCGRPWWGTAVAKAHGTRTLCRVLGAWGGALPQGYAPPIR
jgi:hypothetical protein